MEKRVNVINIEYLNRLKLENYVNSSNTLFISSTRSLNYQSNKNKQFNVIDYTQLHSIIKDKTKDKDCISNNEMRYLLYKTISNLSDNHKTKSAFLNEVNLIYDLFDKLLFSEIVEQNLNLKQIKKTQLLSNANLFELYVDYLNCIKKQNKKTYQSCYKECLKEFLSQYQEVNLMGFTFFNDIQNMMFNILIENNLLSNIIINDELIIKEFITPLLESKNVTYQISNIPNDNKQVFDELRLSLFNNNQVNQSLANNLYFYKPFSTREMEFAFILSQIQDKLKGCSTRAEIEFECEKIAIVITNQFAKQTQGFNELLKRRGVFISADNQIFYSLEGFLKSDYQNKLDKEKRIQLFSTFSRLEMYEPPKTLFNSNIGRFINEIYKISGYGMTLSNFNTLLNINWLFKETEITDIISEFNVIKDFFENLQNVEDWKTQITHLIQLKKNNTLDKELHSHPLNSIRLNSLEFIARYIVFIDNVTRALKNVNGTIKKHIKTLVEAIKNETKDESLEKQLLLEFSEILNLQDNGVNIDNEYFAKNFQTLISDYLSAKTTRTNNIRINAINLESSNSYETVFIPMFENNKYPMSFKYEFPYTKEVCNILKDKNLVKGYYLPLNKDLEYNIKLSKYVFENLFRIAEKEIIFTRIDNEGGNPLDISIYGLDIRNKLSQIKELNHTQNKPFKYKEIDLTPIVKKVKLDDIYLNEMLGYFVCPKMFYYKALYSHKNSYSDKFLLNFYCKSLIVNKTLSCLANDLKYNELSLQKAIKNTLKNVANEMFNMFPLFDDNNKNDIVLSASKQISSFIQEKILTGRYKPAQDFTLSLTNEQEILHKGIKVKTYSALRVFDLKKNIYHDFDISKGFDCLISSTGGKHTQKKHFFEIIEEMESQIPVDLASSLNFLIFKLNTQLNTPKFNQDGIDRVKDVVDIINDRAYTNYCQTKSSFCSYCKFKNICMGGVDNE